MSILDGIQKALTSKASAESKLFLEEYISDELVNSGLEVGVDTLLHSIPGIGATITSYKHRMYMKNLMKLIEVLDKRIDKILENLKERSLNEEELIDSIVNIAVEKALVSKQEGKIKFIVHGLEKVLQNNDISFDIASLYFDTIDRLTLLDIAVLKYYRLPIDMETARFKDIGTILKSFNIDNDIFQATKANLRTIGLLETKTDIKISKDIENLYESLSSLAKKVNSISTAIKDPKKSNKIIHKTISVNRIESKDKFEISKFGRDFHDYFIAENPIKKN